MFLEIVVNLYWIGSAGKLDQNGLENEKSQTEQDFRLWVVFIPLNNVLKVLPPRRCALLSVVFCLCDNRFFKKLWETKFVPHQISYNFGMYHFFVSSLGMEIVHRKRALFYGHYKNVCHN